MKPMLLTPETVIPEGTDWFYEVKYDGFRAILDISEDEILLTSRNGKPLAHLFPEIIHFIKEGFEEIKPMLPLRLDGELVWLENSKKGNFSSIQLRGRLRNETKIKTISEHSPCRFLAFDILLLKNKNLCSNTYLERKKELENLFKLLKWPSMPNPLLNDPIQFIPYTIDHKVLWENIILFDGEGLIAKHRNSKYLPGKRTAQWLKIKHKKTVNCFILSYHKANQFFQIGVYKDSKVTMIGSVKDGFTKEEKQTLVMIMKNNALREDNEYIYISPSICIAVKYLHIYENELREPHFDTFLLETPAMECTWEAFCEHSIIFPSSIKISNPGKHLWESKHLKASKLDFLDYLRSVSSWFLPQLKKRLLTVIRYPDGIQGERFFQKNCPDYAPAFVKTFIEEGTEFILCDNLETLIWLGNLASIEFHVPFQEAGSKYPDEIVLDLDPPTTKQFYLAVKAAIEIKKVLDSINFISFIKTSGNRGIQLHLPLNRKSYSYKETRMFTHFLGGVLTTLFPDEFTTERLKKHRQDRLYLDFVQHAEGKTIIAPYSPRANYFGGVATPLFWEEVNERLNIEDYTIKTVPERIKISGCPFSSYEEARKQQPFDEILSFLKSGGKL